VVELEVAGVDDVPTGVRSAMPIASGIEWPTRNGITRKAPISTSSPGSSAMSGLLWSLCSLILLPSRPRASVAGVDRHARELRQHVRQRADVVLVGVGDEERLDVGAALLEVRDVGDDEVDAEHLLVGEHEAAVDDDDLVAVLEDVHVLADLAHPAERDDAERLIVAVRGASVHRQNSVQLGLGGVVRGKHRHRARRRVVRRFDSLDRHLRW
jgi:hypothetical protein